ncbi:MAG: DegT/DnrJ/EryC1/StrS family aminotransferase [Holophaga sp.]|nr:DegT/DnrJ/EryC1/StrS family aminotransferase [Holophaga sp.]
MTTQTRIPVLDLGPQLEALGAELAQALQRALRSTRYILGPEVRAFEQEAAGYLGTRHAIGLNSGTDALVIALRTLGIGPGDEVITTPFTFFATAEAISQVGATPVFVDVDAASMNLDPALVEAAVTRRTRAILPVHLFGRPCAMTEIQDLARNRGLHVVEDCAQSFGARHRGRHTGTVGQRGCFSFFRSKNVGCWGDGGLLATDDDRLADQARALRAHGSRRKYHNEMLGYNSRLDELQAAVLRVKLPHLEAWNEGRRRVAEGYGRLLAGHPRIVPPPVVEGHVFHQYTVRVLDCNRDRLQARLGQEGVETMVYYPVPCHRLQIYGRSHAQVSCPVAERLSREVLSLPIWPELDPGAQAAVAGALRAQVEQG